MVLGVKLPGIGGVLNLSDYTELSFCGYLWTLFLRGLCVNRGCADSRYPIS